MQIINEISAALEKVSHYEVVVKKYKCAKNVVNWTPAGYSVLSVAFPGASLGSALSIVGLPATILLGHIGGCFACFLRADNPQKKVGSKIKNHQDMVMLATAKREVVDRPFSKAARADNQISDRVSVNYD